MKWPRWHFQLPFGLDWSLYLAPLVLTVFGVAVIFSITYGSKNHLALDQIVYIILGFGIVAGLSMLDYRTLKGLYLILYIVGVLLLILVFAVGSKSFGATRWINLGIFQLQPSEIFKLIFLIVLAKFFADWEKLTWQKILLIFALAALPILLIIKQPDLGTAAVLFIGLIAIFFLSPIRKIYLILVLVGLLAFSPLGWRFLKTYQKDRIKAFVNPSSDPQGTGYNVSQAKIAVGAGGLWGRGLGKGSQSQLNFLPVAHTDFIFAGAAEATGFIGSSFLILLLVFLVWRIALVAQRAKDLFGMYLAGGIGAIFLFQILINIGMNMGMMPVTGIPLPFVSYGGSAMFTNMAAIGILQSIYLRHRKISF